MLRYGNNTIWPKQKRDIWVTIKQFHQSICQSKVVELFAMTKKSPSKAICVSAAVWFYRVCLLVWSPVARIPIGSPKMNGIGILTGIPVRIPNHRGPKPRRIHVWYVSMYGMFTYIYHKNQPFMYVKIPFPWILWEPPRPKPIRWEARGLGVEYVAPYLGRMNDNRKAVKTQPKTDLGCWTVHE